MSARTTARHDALLREVKEREAVGYAYETADASFELLARRMLGTVPKFFDVSYFDVKVEQRGQNGHGTKSSEVLTTAVVKVKIGDDTLISAAEGNGPVNALDVALRKDLGKYQKFIEGLKLTDYRVRILNSRHRSRDARADRERGRDRRALDHGRRVAQYHRCLVPGADRFHRLQAGQSRRAGLRSWFVIASERAAVAPPGERNDRPCLHRGARP